MNSVICNIDVRFLIDRINVPLELLAFANTLGVTLFRAFVPLEDEGMWLHITPIHPGKNDDETIDLTTEKETYILQARSDPTKKRNKDGIIQTLKQSMKLSEGRWVMVPKGSCLLVPITLFYSESFRTNITGNVRCVFDIFAFPNESIKNEFFNNEEYKNNQGYVEFLAHDDGDNPDTVVVAAMTYEKTDKKKDEKSDEEDEEIEEVQWLHDRAKSDYVSLPTNVNRDREEDKLLEVQGLSAKEKSKLLNRHSIKYEDVAKAPCLKYLTDGHRGFGRYISL